MGGMNQFHSVRSSSRASISRGGNDGDRGSRNISGSGITRTIMDGRGRTESSVRGSNNNITFKGDHGANRFTIGGQGNNVNVFNLGRDDKVKLEGPGWREVTDKNKRDGKLRFENSLTGSVVVVRTDAGRNDKFVRARVEYDKTPPPAPAPAAVTAAVAAVAAPPAPPVPPPAPSRVTVQRLDEHTLAVGDDGRKILLNDRDRDGYVDQVAVATRDVSRVYTGTLQRAQTLLAGTEDSNVRTQAFEGAANIALAQDLNALQADAFDGKIDYEAAFDRAVQILTRAESAGQGGTATTVMTGVKDDVVLENGSTSVGLDALNAGAGKAAVESATIEFATGKYTIANIFDSTGRDGAMSARVAQAGDGGQRFATFAMIDRESAGREQTTHAFGAKYGSVGKGDVVAQGGAVNGSLGYVGQFWARGSAMHQAAPVQVARQDRLNGGSDAAPEVPAQAGKPTVG